MMPFTLPLDHVSRADLATVGQKAANLGEMARAGLPVLPSLCFTAEAYRAVLGPLEAHILARATPDAVADPVEVEDVGSDIRAWIEEAAWPEGLVQALREAEQSLAAAEFAGASPYFAARTSMPAEELASAFGSGVQRAVLGVRAGQDLRRAIAQCWAAPFNSRGLYYRGRKKLKQTGVDVGVLVQRLAAPDAAGVLFTANPLNGSRDEINVESVWGLGEPVTSARVTPDRYVLSRSGETQSEVLAYKAVRLDPAPEGGTYQIAVPEERQESSSMPAASLAELAALADKTESLFNEPQEIEWCRVGERIYLLQSRPIGQRK